MMAKVVVMVVRKSSLWRTETGHDEGIGENRPLQQMQKVCRLDSSDPVYTYVAVVLIEHNSVWLLLSEGVVACRVCSEDTRGNDGKEIGSPGTDPYHIALA